MNAEDPLAGANCEQMITSFITLWIILKKKTINSFAGADVESFSCSAVAILFGKSGAAWLGNW